jgi:hypothetical protein
VVKPPRDRPRAACDRATAVPPSPFLISQILTIKHTDDLPDPRQEIHGTRPNPDQRVIPAAQSEDLWHREGLPVRDKNLWRLAYDSAARANEILSLDLPDCVPVLESSGVRHGGRTGVMSRSHSRSAVTIFVVDADVAGLPEG